VRSRNLVSEEALANGGLLRQKEKIFVELCFMVGDLNFCNNTTV